MKRYSIFFLFLCLLVFPLWADLPAPPPWLYGQWQTVLEGEDGSANALILVFLPSDILMNGNSVKEMIYEGYIVNFNQQISEGIYTLHIDYASGFWWEESFPMPVITSVYIDESYEEGDYSTMIYQFLPLGIAPSAQIPNDFE